MTVPSVPHDEKKPNPPVGVGLAAWSHDAALLLTRNDNMPNALWVRTATATTRARRCSANARRSLAAVQVWDTATLELKALLLHDDPVKSAKWEPGQHRLAICTGVLCGCLRVCALE